VCAFVMEQIVSQVYMLVYNLQVYVVSICPGSCELCVFRTQDSLNLKHAFIFLASSVQFMLCFSVSQPFPSVITVKYSSLSRNIPNKIIHCESDYEHMHLCLCT
jgi:hypothetical protein